MANLSFSFSSPTPGIEDVVFECEFKILTSRIVPLLTREFFIHVLLKNPQKKLTGILYNFKDEIQRGLIFVVDRGKLCP